MLVMGLKYVCVQTLTIDQWLQIWWSYDIIIALQSADVGLDYVLELRDTYL